MNKKLGIILMFVAAYIVLLGGLFWNMSLPKEIPAGAVHGNVYDWFWGLSAGVVMACGAALCIKKNYLCLVGLGVNLIGTIYALVILIVGSSREAYFSPWILIGVIISAISIAITTLFYFKEAKHIKEHGNILL